MFSVLTIETPTLVVTGKYLGLETARDCEFAVIEPDDHSLPLMIPVVDIRGILIKSGNPTSATLRALFDGVNQ
jgi:hypothetical protein